MYIYIYIYTHAMEYYSAIKNKYHHLQQHGSILLNNIRTEEKKYLISLT